MARPYSRKSLARHIADSYDTASASTLFNKSLEFIQAEQNTREYLYYLELFLKRDERPQRIQPSEPSVTEIDEVIVNVVGSEQGVVRFSVPANLEIDVEARMHFDYKVVDAYYESFQIRFYPSALDYDTRRPIPADDSKYPENIRIIPSTPFVLPGDYIHELRFTPTYAGDIFISIDLIEREVTDETDETGRDLYQFIDVDGNRFVDVDGNVFVGLASPMFQFVDINDQRFVDVNGNVFIGFR